jgi:hypothetical protein
MNVSSVCWSMTLVFVLLSSSASAKGGALLGDNAALRYWVAFAQMQDATLNQTDARQLTATISGDVPYDDAKYSRLLLENKDALATLSRAVAIHRCDWGLDYQLGEELPVDYARKALALGRLNVLSAYHQLAVGDSGRAASTLVAGLHFSQDVANGGSLFATAAAKSLLSAHLRAVAVALRSRKVSAAQRAVLQNALVRLGAEPLDWLSASRRDLEALKHYFAQDSGALAALRPILSTYPAAVAEPTKLPALDAALSRAPKQVADVIPNAKHLLEEKQALDDQLKQVQAMLR